MKVKIVRALAPVAHFLIMVIAMLGFLSGRLSRETSATLIAAYAVLAVPMLLLQHRIQKMSTTEEIGDTD